MKADVLIIGTGQAAPPLATRLAALGKRVLVVERGELGGTCVNTGCTPTKTLVASARAAHVARTAARLGVRCSVEVDFAAVMARKDAVVQQWRASVQKRLASSPERLTLLRGHARFVGPREVEVAGERHRADVVVLNVGGRAVVPSLPGLEGVGALDNHSVMELRALPGHLLVLGGGYVGCEFGQLFRRLGAAVTVADHQPHLLAREDEDVSQALEQVFRAEGLALELGAKPERVERAGGEVVLHLAGGRALRGTHLLAATGRRPNTDDLGCERAGIKLDAKGFVLTDERYRASAEGVYAVGDCTSEPQFTHVSWDDHRLLFDLLTGRSTRGREGRVIPSVVYTDPQVGRVGLSEKEARQRKLAYEVATLPFGHIARAIETDETAGLVKVLLDPKSELLLGAAVVGAEGGELVHVFSTLMQARASARAVVEGEYAHPSFCEGLQTALMRLARYALK